MSLKNGKSIFKVIIIYSKKGKSVKKVNNNEKQEISLKNGKKFQSKDKTSPYKFLLIFNWRKNKKKSNLF